VRADFRARSRLCGPEDRNWVVSGPSSSTIYLWFDLNHRTPARSLSSTSFFHRSRCVRRLVTSRLRQSPASPSGPVQHASFLQVGVLLTGRAVLWRLTTCCVLDRDRRQSEDVFSHQITVASKQQYPCARTDAHRYSTAKAFTFLYVSLHVTRTSPATQSHRSA
jgi:hypothetical protein